MRISIASGGVDGARAEVLLVVAGQPAGYFAMVTITFGLAIASLVAFTGRGAETTDPEGAKGLSRDNGSAECFYFHVPPYLSY